VDTPIGVVLHESLAYVDDLLADFARALRAEGENVGGLVQKNRAKETGKAEMSVVDLRTDRVFRISQNLGPSSSSCCLDLTGMAEASQVLRREIGDGVALLVVNKFASAESEGGGFLAETFEAVSQGIPVLTSVSFRFKAGWDQLTGGAGEMLTPDRAALFRWWDRVRAWRARSGALA